MHPLAAIFWLLFALCCSAQACANPYERRLANGLRVIVKEDHRAPTAVQQVWYRAGSMDEPVGATGVAHVLEHLMFKGTRRIGPGEFSRRVAEAGGRENAFTGRDYTAYFQQVHKERLPLVMELEADRMGNLVISADEFSREIKVVMEERRMRTEDRPRSLVHEAMLAAAFKAHPYHWPVIGWMNDLENMTWRDARDWYRRWYAPNNAVVVIVGDVVPADVFKWAERYYGRIKPKALPERKHHAEPPQRGLRRVAVKAPAEQPYVMFAYKVPVLHGADGDWEAYALQVLEGLLDGNDSARLNQQLVRELRVANSAGAGYDWVARGPGMLVLDGTVARGRSTAELEAGLREQVARLAAEEAPAEELARVKSQLVAREVYKRDSIFGQAMEIGVLETAGLSWRMTEQVLQGLRAVTAGQVKSVAARYLVEDNLTVGVLDPQPLPGAKPALPPRGLRH